MSELLDAPAMMPGPGMAGSAEPDVVEISPVVVEAKKAGIRVSNGIAAEIERTGTAAPARDQSADYYTPILRAVAHLEVNDAQTRRALYVRAEKALMAELRGVDPPLPRFQITRERLCFYEAIRRVEAGIVRSNLRLACDPERSSSGRTKRATLRGGPDRSPQGVAGWSPVAGDYKKPREMRTVYAIGRIAIAVVFIVSGGFSLMDIAGAGAVIASKVADLPEPLAAGAASIETMLGLPFPHVLAIAGAVLEVAAGLAIATGIFTRSAVLILIALTAADIYCFHNFWELQTAERSDQMLRALNELSITGGLLILLTATTLRAPGPRAATYFRKAQAYGTGVSR